MSQTDLDDDIRYRNLFNTMAQGIVYQDADGRIISANPAAEKILGLTFDQMTGRTSMDPRWRAIHEDGSEFSGETHPAIVALKTGKRVDDVVMGVFNPETQTYRWINVNAVPEFKEGEKSPFQVFTTFQDITEQKKAEKALIESEERYRQIFNIAPAGIYEVDYRTGKIVSANDAICEYSGYARDEILSMNPLKLLTEESQVNFLKRVEKILNGEAVPETAEYTARRKDGSTFELSINTRFIYKDDDIVGATVVGQDITRQKQAIEALKRSEERYRIIADNVADVIWTMDMDLNFTYISPSIYQQRGYTSEEAMGHSIEEVILPDSLELVTNMLAEKLSLIEIGDEKGFEAAYFEVKQPCKDGSIIWTSNTARIIPGPDQKAVSMLGVTRDITERKLAEDGLKESQERFKNIVNESPMGIHMYELKEDNRLVFTGANPASDNMLGASHEQFMGKTIEEAFPGLVDTEVPARYREAAMEGKTWRTEQINYNEGQINGAFEVVAFQTESNKMVVFFNEITARKQVEAALFESEEKFRTLVEESPLGISLIDKEGRYIYLNPQFEKMMGYTIDDIPTGKEWFKVAFPDQKYRRNAIKTWIRDQKHSGIGQARPRVYRVTCKDGIQREISFRPVTMEDLNQFVIYEDITDRLRMEQQLQQAQKLEAIGTLAGGIAHDFNNLLMGIQGRASLISTDLHSSNPHMEHISAIEEYVKSAVALTKQLLGFARGGKYEVKSIDINNLVKDSATMFGRTRKEIKIHINALQQKLSIEADKGQLEQVLLNIYVNAWQAMPSGGDLYIQTNRVRLNEKFCTPNGIESGDYAKISITDTGMGMDKDVCQRIFDPFFTTKDKTRGTGLGLASAYGIIKNHNGIITVHSELGKGTIFDIYLPVSDKQVYHETDNEKTLIKGSETILLVDDEEMIIHVAQAMLKKLGYRVLICNGGHEAIGIVKRKRKAIDLIILDLIMPDMDGGIVFDLIREIESHMPVILSSGYAINGQATEIMRRGCNGFIQKPFNISDLSIKIREVLDKPTSSE